MNLITPTFGIILFNLLLIGIGYAMTWTLAHFSEQAIISIAQSGRRGVAKALLSIFIGYDQRIYDKSKLEFWLSVFAGKPRLKLSNQVAYRFGVLWGCTLLLLPLLFLLKDRQVIDSVGQIWLVLLFFYFGFRALMHWTVSRSTADDIVVNQPVNKHIPSAPKHYHPLDQRWDYLDKLFT